MMLINLYDCEQAARQAMSTAYFSYYAGGTADEITCPCARASWWMSASAPCAPPCSAGRLLCLSSLPPPPWPTPTARSPLDAVTPDLLAP